MSWFKKIIPQQEDTEAFPQEVSEADEEGDSEGELAIDVYQDGDNLVLQSTVAGVKPEDIDISLSADQVTIRGERQRQRQVENEDYLFQECYWGNFSRTMSLPVEIDVDKATADIKDGILTLTMPKEGKTRTKKVKVTTEE